MSDGERLPTQFTQEDLFGIWDKALGAAARNLGEDCVEQWIRPLRLQRIENDLAIVSASTNFMAEWVERNFGLHLLRYLQTGAASVRRIDFTVVQPSTLTGAAPCASAKPVSRSGQPESVPAPNGAVPAAPAGPSGPHDGLASAPLDPRFTFESFVVGKPNELAHAAARRVAESQDVSYNPVFLYGGVGLGKTHLMHAIGHHLRDHRPDCKVLFLSAEQFMYRFVQALRFRDTITFKQQFRSVDVLMVDDVQFIANKDSTQDEFFHTFNALIDQNKQIVISGDRSPGQMDGVEERIKSRLQWGLVVDIHPTDYELRLGVLQQKAEIAQAQCGGAEIEPKVLEFLAHRVSQNVRILEGALNRLFAFADLTGRRIDLETTQECLADLLRTAERKVLIDDIKQRVCHQFNLRMSDLTSARRARAVARPRQVAMYLAKTLTAKSLPEIGRAFGGRDHTTVLHAIRKIEQLRETDAQLDEDIEVLRRMLEA